MPSNFLEKMFNLSRKERAAAEPGTYKPAGQAHDVHPEATVRGRVSPEGDMLARKRAIGMQLLEARLRLMSSDEKELRGFLDAITAEDKDRLAVMPKEEIVNLALEISGRKVQAEGAAKKKAA